MLYIGSGALLYADVSKFRDNIFAYYALLMLQINNKYMHT